MSKPKVKCIKPCDTCPFRKTSLLGLWQSSHILATYVDSSAASIPPRKMGCHKYNGLLKPNLPTENSPACGGWIRRAWDSPAVRFYNVIHDVDYPRDFDPKSMDEELWTVEELAEQNGLDMSKLMPLEWSKDLDVPYEDWTGHFRMLRRICEEFPQFIDAHLVVEGSPLDVGVTEAQIQDFMGVAG